MGHCSDRTSTKDRPTHRKRTRSKTSTCDPQLDNLQLATDFRAALAAFSCPVPPAFIKDLCQREQNTSIGKVHVSLRVSPAGSLAGAEGSVLSLDKRRRQVTIKNPMVPLAPDRLGVSAPKMFVFDQVYSQEETGGAVCSRVLPDILQTVLCGTDGCIMSFGSNGTGRTQTMVGSHLEEPNLGVMPVAISWLYQAIAHLKANKPARFSVRVSATVIDGIGQVSDVLGYFAPENETSPGAFLRQGSAGLLSSIVELRAPFPEIAARYLDLALSARRSLDAEGFRNGLGPTTLLYTLHIYQYTFDKANKGKVTGGRSRLHLLDFGDLSGGRHNEGLSLSSLTSVLLAIFSGQKYLPHKHNRLTQLLHEILGSVTCHTSMIVHVSPLQRHLQHTLATLQLASRVHRLRRKKIKGMNRSGSRSSGSDGSRSRSSGDTSGGTSVDFSSSDQSADTVIYIGGGSAGDSSDGEHPPVFFPHHIRRHRSVELPRLNSFEHLRSSTASPNPVINRRPISASPTPTSRSVPLGVPRAKPRPPPRRSSGRSLSNVNNNCESPVTFYQPGFVRHQPGVCQINYNERSQSKNSEISNSLRQANYTSYNEPNSNVPIFKNNSRGQPLDKSSSFTTFNFDHGKRVSPKPQNSSFQRSCEVDSSKLRPNSFKDSYGSEEQWIDGPKVSKNRITTVKKESPTKETWVDGPSVTKNGSTICYGYMDDHKKTMIERWVEIQTAQVGSNPNLSVGEVETKKELHNGTSNEQKQSLGSEDLNVESDVETTSEDQSGMTSNSDSKQPDLITELEKKHLIPINDSCRLQDLTINNIMVDSLGVLTEDACSECEAIAEECEELGNILSHEEESSKKCPKGLATVVEEPELESAFGGDDVVEEDSVSLLNNPQTDCEEYDGSGAVSDGEKSSLSVEVKHQLNTARTSSSFVQRTSKKMEDSCVQVCEEDIKMSINEACAALAPNILCNGDHPLRALSEENLTCASTFTDSCSHIEEVICEDEAEEERPFSIFEASSNYGNMCPSFNSAHPDLRSDLQELDNIHSLFSAFTSPPGSEDKNALLNTALFRSLIESRKSLHVEPQFNYSCQPLETPFVRESIPSNHLVSNKPHVNSVNKSFSVNQNSCMSCSTNNNNIRTEQVSMNGNLTTVLNNHSLSMDKSTATDEDLNYSRGNIVNNDNEPLSLCNFNNLHISSMNCNLNISNSLLENGPRTPNDNCLSTERGIYMDTVVNRSDDDSDNISCTSEDSEYLAQNSKFSKFLCVGLGRSKSKPYMKTKIANGKNVDNKKSSIKIKDRKTKSFKEKSLVKFEEHDSKNGVKSLSQSLPVNSIEINSCPLILMENKSRPHLCRSDSDFECGCGTTFSLASPIQCQANMTITTRPCTTFNRPEDKSWGVNPSSIPSCQNEHLAENICNKTASSTLTSGSVGTAQSLGESSGYESIPRDSECSSFSSSQDSEVDDESKRFQSLFRNQKCPKSLVSPSGHPNELPSIRLEPKSQSSFLRHLTKRNPNRNEEKLISSTTWKYRC